METIIVEDRLIELFDTLPVIVNEGKNFKPVFDFGTHEDLLRFLKSKQKEGVTPYPLIWLETGFDVVGEDHEKTVSIKLILAVNTDSIMSNRERLEVTIKLILIPLQERIFKALRRSSITDILDDRKNKTSIRFNLSENDISQATEIWDAIILQSEVTINNQFLKTINYD